MYAIWEDIDRDRREKAYEYVCNALGTDWTKAEFEEEGTVFTSAMGAYVELYAGADYETICAVQHQLLNFTAEDLAGHNNALEALMHADTRICYIPSIEVFIGLHDDALQEQLVQAVAARKN